MIGVDVCVCDCVCVCAVVSIFISPIDRLCLCVISERAELFPTVVIPLSVLALRILGVELLLPLLL